MLTIYEEYKFYNLMVIVENEQLLELEQSVKIIELKTTHKYFMYYNKNMWKLYYWHVKIVSI